MSEPNLDPEDVRRALEYLDVLPDVAAAAASLRMAVTHDFGPLQGEVTKLAVDEVTAALTRFQLIDPEGFAAVVSNEQDWVDDVRRRLGLGPEAR